MNFSANFKLITIDHEIELLSQELIVEKPWDHIFYRGEFDHEVSKVRFIEPCRNCYVNWFDIPFTTFEKYRLVDLVRDKYLTELQIEKNKLAIIHRMGDLTIYKTILGFTANYVLVHCDNCFTKHLITLGLGETQPALYAGQIQGMWKIK